MKNPLRKTLLLTAWLGLTLNATSLAQNIDFGRGEV